MAFQGFYSGKRKVPARGRNSVRSSVCEYTPPGRIQPHSRPRSVFQESTSTSPLSTRSRHSASREDAVYEPGMSLDALTRPPTTEDYFDDESAESEIEHPMPNQRSPVQPEKSDIAVMLQQQQGVLMNILANQTKMEAKYSEFDTKLKPLEEKLSRSVSPSSTGETKPRKCIVTAVLTVSVIDIPHLVELKH